MERDRIVGITSGLVSVLRVLNVVFGVLAILLLIATWPAHDLLATQLIAKYGAQFPVDTLIWQLRGLFILALAGTALIDRVLRELGRVLVTLRAGDPFASANANRVTAIAWALLIWQVLELVLGLLTLAIRDTGADTASSIPSIGGWLAVLVAFVLARVFAAGSRMRDELAATI